MDLSDSIKREEEELSCCLQLSAAAGTIQGSLPLSKKQSWPSWNVLFRLTCMLDWTYWWGPGLQAPIYQWSLLRIGFTQCTIQQILTSHYSPQVGTPYHEMIYKTLLNILRTFRQIVRLTSEWWGYGQTNGYSFHKLKGFLVTSSFTNSARLSH